MNSKMFLRSVSRLCCVAVFGGAYALAEPPVASFGSGFHKEEKTGEAVFRWARQEATFSVVVPSSGRYALEIGLCSAFRKQPVRVDLAQKGSPVITFLVTATEPNHLQVCRTVLDLTGGPNELVLRSDAPEIRFSAVDQRDVSIGVGTTFNLVPEPTSPATR